jgi:hypothetical protein
VILKQWSKLLCLKVLAAFNLYAQHLAWFALSKHFEGAATHFAVGGEPLAGDARVQNEIKLLPTVRTLDGCRAFHVFDDRGAC